jgi:hypothetical protein
VIGDDSVDADVHRAMCGGTISSWHAPYGHVPDGCDSVNARCKGPRASNGISPALLVGATEDLGNDILELDTETGRIKSANNLIHRRSEGVIDGSASPSSTEWACSPPGCIRSGSTSSTNGTFSNSHARAVRSDAIEAPGRIDVGASLGSGGLAAGRRHDRKQPTVSRGCGAHRTDLAQAAAGE